MPYICVTNPIDTTKLHESGAKIKATTEFTRVWLGLARGRAEQFRDDIADKAAHDEHGPEILDGVEL